MEEERKIGEKDRVEILLEHVVTKVDAIAEGHGILLEKIEQVDKKVDMTKKDLEDMIMSSSKALHGKIDKVEQKVDAVKDELKQDIQKVDKKIDKLDEKMTNRQDKIEEKVDIVHQKVFGH